jgi:threonine/homoserine/homoserine lactone efflux protein
LSPEIVASLAAFSAAALLLTVTPGLDTALVLRTATGEGQRPAFAAALGIGLGCLIWATIVALGLGALLAASELAYTILRWAGAAYLVWIGTRLILDPRTAFEPGAAATDHRGAATWFVRGFLTNILNPKVGVFYVSFLPQFVPHGVAVAPFVMLLGAMHVVMGVAWLSLLIGATRPIARMLRRPAVLKTLDRLTGAVFLAFGARLALESRR